MRKGFVSMSVIYSFLLIFLLVLLSILGIYMQKSRLVDGIVGDAKKDLENGIELITPVVEVCTFTSKNFEYINGEEIFDVPCSGKYKLEVWGAEGGGSRLSGNASSGQGGKGGYSYGEITLTTLSKLYIYVGGYGSSSISGIAQGGFNGGGSAHASSSSEPGNGGGGASDIRIDSASLYARVIVAGGGGGGGEDPSDSYGHGGGQSGIGYNTTYDASQTTSGLNGAFGLAATTNYGDGGGGGGGWYGGGTTTQATQGADTQGGGGGSGYIYTEANALNYPAGCLLNSIYYLVNADTIAGNLSFTSPSGNIETGHSGNGYARITYIEN